MSREYISGGSFGVSFVSETLDREFITHVGFIAETQAVAAGGLVKVWTGSVWAEKPAKVWTGSAWVQKPVKFWNGSSWVLA